MVLELSQQNAIFGFAINNLKVRHLAAVASLGFAPTVLARPWLERPCQPSARGGGVCGKSLCHFTKINNNKILLLLL